MSTMKALKWVAILGGVALILMVGLSGRQSAIRLSWSPPSSGWHLEAGYLSNMDTVRYDIVDSIERLEMVLVLSGRFYRCGPVTVTRNWDTRSHIAVTNPWVAMRTTRIF